jgi:hypothetical protein
MATKNLTTEPQRDFTKGECPEVLKNKRLSIENHQICIVKADLGPPNPKMPEVIFWLMKSAKWNVSEHAAREMVCGNCCHYWKTKFIDDCMKQYEQVTPPEVDPEWVDTGESGGYCDEWDIPCTHSRTCNSWEPGGPITDAKGKNTLEYEDEEDKYESE